ncbi:histidine phosphatase family protein [Pseudonocardiaceae bacterium YIM PH 21723]|nr:histidine phosphatase family protein [Pseudonocardiaceae bacterium YIM PH 21723]
MGVTYLIRHGQANTGLGDYDKLTDLGKRQATALGASLARRVSTVDRVLVGKMRRHRETAESCLASMGLDGTFEEEPLWNEFDHEDVIAQHKPSYRNKAVMAADLGLSLNPRRTFQKVFDQALERWSSGEHEGYPEPFESFVDRSNQALATVRPSDTTLVFTSGGVIASITARLLGLDPAGWRAVNRVMINAGVTKVVHGGSGTSLISLNDHSHFEGATRDLLTYR